MIAKDLPKPLWLIATEILEKRLIQGHSIQTEIRKDVARRQAGYWGEQILSEYVKELPHDKYYIFHDLQLKNEGVYFQIDTLLLSIYFALIIESKNIKGNLTFDSVFKQLFRENLDGTIDVFDDPRVQAECHKILLQRFLAAKGINYLPIEHLVFFANSNSKLFTKTGDTSDFSKVCKGRSLFLKIDELEKNRLSKKMNDEKLEDLKNLILSSHTPKQVDILGEYKTTKADIRIGHRCPICDFIPLIMKNGKLFCSNCELYPENALQINIRDYSLLIGLTITNSEFRNFFQISSPDIAQKHLKSLKLPYTGTTRNRIYKLDGLIYDN